LNKKKIITPIPNKNDKKHVISRKHVMSRQLRFPNTLPNIYIYKRKKEKEMEKAISADLFG
jgi:hypothetical protein